MASLPFVENLSRPIARAGEMGTPRPRAESEKGNMSEALKAQREEQGVLVPANKAGALSNGNSARGYLAEHATTAVTYIKFGKAGQFEKSGTNGETVPEKSQFIVPYTEIQALQVKFNGPGNSPDRHGGPIFKGVVPPRRETLGDLDRETWPIGLSGQPEDPWVLQLLMPLQSVETGELFCFQTSSKTGRRAVDAVIAMCERMQVTEPDFYPIIELRVGGFEHKKNPRIGFVKTPQFVRVGKAPKSDIRLADTSLSGDLNDSIPF